MLLDPLTIRTITFRNRIAVSPMCMYSSQDGFANDWHLVHLGSRAVGGAGLVFTEAAAVEARGRISPQDLGIWKDEHIGELRRITSFITAHGAVAGIQLAHAGRKASTARPWDGSGPVGSDRDGWEPLMAPSSIAFDGGYQQPQEMTLQDIDTVKKAFGAAAMRSLEAGFQVAEVHAAHGYLLHEFLSPASNQRSDHYGGSFENRTRLLMEIVKSIRETWPRDLPLFVRISATDWIEHGGWTIEESIQLSRALLDSGVDLIDCSSGGNLPKIKIPLGPGYQTHFAERIRRESGIMTGAVGMITSPEQADTIIRTGQADMVLLAREFLRDPYFGIHAAQKLGKKPDAPAQYARAM